MTNATHKIHLFIQSIADKHGVDYNLDTESRKILINFVMSAKFMGEEGIEMLIIAFLVGYDKGATNNIYARNQIGTKKNYSRKEYE
ncbi:hypothetical protein LCGC14_0617660 [marine sediment metagenome]|uniref:Uncharacterized protein n=1 Tax=marine sediment metagenome TaxID=412755 RepID=A0A0F9RAM9_9ZZZZ